MTTPRDKGRDGGDRATLKATSAQAHDSPVTQDVSRPPLTDAVVDRCIEQTAAGRASVEIADVLRIMGAADDDTEARAAVWLRLQGETLLPGLAGHVQRAAALRLMVGSGPMSAQDIVAALRRHAPGAPIDDALLKVLQHAERLESEGGRRSAQCGARDAGRGGAIDE